MAAAPELLQDIAPGPSGSFPYEFIEFAGATYFVADQTELWKTDGTANGTVLVHDAVGGADTSLIGLNVHEGKLVFAQIDRGGTQFDSRDDRSQIWKSDGSSQGTVLVHDFGAGSSLGLSEGAYFASVRGELFTTVRTPSFGTELWKVDLVSNGAALVKDIQPGDGGSYPSYLFPHDGSLYFAANDGETGYELWKTDGTSAGTMLVKDLNPVNSSIGSYPQLGNSFPNGFVAKDGKFYFTARTDGADSMPFTEDDHGQLWSSDGSTGGTVLIKDFGPGAQGDYSQLLNIGGTLFGTVQTSSRGRELWKSDGTGPGTVLVKDIHPNDDTSLFRNGSHPRFLTDVNGVLFFSADDGVHGTELWKSDGTSSGTVMVKDLDPRDAGDGPTGSYPFGFANANGTLYFSASDGSAGAKLWKSDGTSSGTVLVGEIVANRPSSPYPIQFIQGNLYFGASDALHGSEPWVLRIGRGTDYGDALASYGTAVANDGARHELTSSLVLGTSADAEADGLPSRGADSDDISSSVDDEEGLPVIPRFTPGQSTTFVVKSSGAGQLDAWLDWNRNGVFDHPAEHMGGGNSFIVQAGENSVAFSVPEAASLGATYARFRLSTSGGLGPKGLAVDGEVEDYFVAIRGSGSSSDWRNPVDPLDSNGDNHVSPIDALVIINTLNSVGSRQLGASPGAPASWYDTDGDGFAAPRDVLLVVNFLNRALGEGEANWEPPALLWSGIFQSPARRDELMDSVSSLSKNSRGQPRGGLASKNSFGLWAKRD